jgi:hypothetical protein
MFEEDSTIKVPGDIKELILFIWKAVKARQVLEFPFESIKGNTGKRKIKPYMVHVNQKKEIRVAGLPEEFWHVPPRQQQKNARQYLLAKIDRGEIKVIAETFDDPGVPRKWVVSTTEVEIIFRFIYSDEDANEVMKSWLKIKGLDLT